jgi:crossover junction endodeoxyribonuclease RuvC
MPIIIGIDPGTRCTGYGVIDTQSGNHNHITHGQINTKGDDMSQRLHQIYQQLSDIIFERQPHALAIEKAFFHRDPQAALKLGQARGTAMVVGAKFALPVIEYSPREVKLGVVGYGAASKEQIQHMVMTLLKLKTKPASDAADALAIAICHANTYRLKEKLQQAVVTAGEGA